MKRICLINLFECAKTILSLLGNVVGKHGKWHEEHCIPDVDGTAICQLNSCSIVNIVMSFVNVY